jgi:hypothetical protein
MRPQFTRHRAVLWLLANLITFRTQQKRELTLQEYVDFATDKNLAASNGETECVRGNFLTNIDATTM